MEPCLLSFLNLHFWKVAQFCTETSDTGSNWATTPLFVRKDHGWIKHRRLHSMVRGRRRGQRLTCHPLGLPWRLGTQACFFFRGKPHLSKLVCVVRPTLTTHQLTHLQYKGPEYMLNRHPHKVLGLELVTKKKGSGGFWESKKFDTPFITRVGECCLGQNAERCKMSGEETWQGKA